MKTVDIVMPHGGSRGGVEYVINSWTKSFISTKYDLRIFHTIPGNEDYLDGYAKQWSIPINDIDNFRLDMEYCADNYAYFINKCGPPDLIIATWIPLVTSACRSVCESLGLNSKIISWIHSGINVYKQMGWGGIEHLAFADFHFCISQNNRNDILRAYPEAKAFLIGNPVKKIDVTNTSPDKHTLCFVGRIDKEKRLDVILNALALASDKSWKLLVAGTGTLHEEMIALSNDLGISKRVSFLGWQENPWEAVKEASTILIASDYEGFSITALEASSIGKTVISTPVSGCTDYIEVGKNGYFFDNNDPQNLASILDFISEGKLPICDRELCRKSVSPYVLDNYFERVDKYLEICMGEEF